MALFRKQPSFALKSGLFAACVSLAAVILANLGQCMSESGTCILITPAMWLYWAPSFLLAWAIVAAIMRYFERGGTKQ